MDLQVALRQIVIMAAVLVAGVAIGRYTTPTKVVTKIEEKIVEKEVIKTKEVTSRDTNKNRELVVTETISPDGTRKIEKHYINRDEVKEDTTRTNVATTTRDTEIKASSVTTNEKNDWNLSALVTTSHTQDDFLHGSQSYGIHVQRRVIGPFSIGAFGITNRTYGLSIGASF